MVLLGAIQVLCIALILEIGHPPPPHNANNVGLYTFEILICADPYTQPSHTVSCNTLMAPYFYVLTVCAIGAEGSSYFL